MTLHHINFSPRVLFEAFGSKNIEVDSIAFAEQIKNSRDAKAMKVILDFREYDKDIISILDDGIGMNENEIIQNWLLVGTENKVNIKDALGGKGIGRFSLFRIANNITIITKKKNEPEYELSLKKEILENLDFAEDFQIEIIQNKNPKCFKNDSDSGTKIILTGLKQIDFSEIFYDLHNLIEPDEKSNFLTKIDYKYPESYSEPYVMPMDNAIKYAPFMCKASFRSNNIIKYDFICKVNNEILYRNNDVKRLSNKFADLDQIDLGEVKFYLLNYYFDPTYVNLLSIPKDEIQCNFLNIYQGISVYRQGFKVYGHGKTDWLNLAEMRVEKPKLSIDNKLSFGYVSLKRPDSDLLEEKTNREGFIKGDTYNYFRDAIYLIIEEFNKDRVKSVDKIRNGEKKNDFKVIKNIIQNGSKNEQKNDIDINVDSSDINIPNNPQTEPKHQKIQNEVHTLKNDKNIPQKLSKTFDEKYSNDSSSVLKPKPMYSNNIIIDASFKCLDTTPEKIKRIVYELQTLKETKNQPVLYSQALLLRCLIDISTQYAQEKLEIERNKDDLLGNITKLLNHIWQKNLLTNKKKHITELRAFIKDEDIIKYFNGIAHDYDYKTHFDDLKKIWDKFEFYISFCINQ